MKKLIFALLLLVATGCDKGGNTPTPQAEDWRKANPTSWTPEQVQTVVREKLEKEFNVRLAAAPEEFRYTNLGGNDPRKSGAEEATDKTFTGPRAKEMSDVEYRVEPATQTRYSAKNFPYKAGYDYSFQLRKVNEQKYSASISVYEAGKNIGVTFASWPLVQWTFTRQ